MMFSFCTAIFVSWRSDQANNFLSPTLTQVLQRSPVCVCVCVCVCVWGLTRLNFSSVQLWPKCSRDKVLSPVGYHQIEFFFSTFGPSAPKTTSCFWRCVCGGLTRLTFFLVPLWPKYFWDKVMLPGRGISPGWKFSKSNFGPSALETKSCFQGVCTRPNILLSLTDLPPQLISCKWCLCWLQHLKMILMPVHRANWQIIIPIPGPTLTENCVDSRALLLWHKVASSAVSIQVILLLTPGPQDDTYASLQAQLTAYYTNADSRA